MKRITRDNFFKNTYCQFKEVPIDRIDNLKLEYHSKSDSKYFYTNEGVYRLADHWGRVANCRWSLDANEGFQNQKYHLGYAKWTNFHELNDAQKLFYLKVDFTEKRVTFFHKEDENYNQEHLFTALEAQHRTRKIRELLKNNKWAKYYGDDIEIVQEKVIRAFSSSNKSLQEIKLSL